MGTEVTKGAGPHMQVSRPYTLGALRPEPRSSLLDSHCPLPSPGLLRGDGKEGSWWIEWFEWFGFSEVTLKQARPSLPSLASQLTVAMETRRL